MCVRTRPIADTMYFAGWFADASMLPVTTGLPLVGTFNDYESKTCAGNLMVMQLAQFDWTARNSSRMYEVNCMSSFGITPGHSGAPAGWKGHCTSGDNFGPGDCGWKSRPPSCAEGCCISQLRIINGRFWVITERKPFSFREHLELYLSNIQ